MGYSARSILTSRSIQTLTSVDTIGAHMYHLDMDVKIVCAAMPESRRFDSVDWFEGW